VYSEPPDLSEASENEVSSAGSHTPGLARLLAAVEELPQRYAPFYGRLAALWDVGEDAVQATLARARDPRAFRATGLRGVQRLAVSGGSERAGVSRELLRLEPGARFPAHVHEGREAVLVLEGSYRDGGREFGPGDAQEMPPGSAHSLQVSDGSICVAAVVSHGFAFTSLPLRLIQLMTKIRV
jgi:quercetin dioxygenase-like cupin family protein